MRTNLAVGILLMSASTAITAPQLPPEAPPPGPLVVELNVRGEVLRPDGVALALVKAKRYFAAEFELRKRDAEKHRKPIAKAITLRVHRETPFRDLHQMLEAAIAAGFVEPLLEAIDPK
ncbi:MAG TPA: hypothetical protein VHR66_18090 [Gemmataceae bacterium]|jgi:hypothetical protein|nr:hypothetical protein [Gemmataceae bacterium]